MKVFDPDVALRLNQVLGGQIRTLSGDSSPLGDKIIQYSTAGDAILMVSDGYSNSGRPLDEALPLAKASNATVFAIKMEAIVNDASVEISGTNTAVLDGDYLFTVIVRSSGTYKGPLKVYADDKLIYSDNIMVNRSSSIKIAHAFSQIGTHILRSSIASDIQPLNNDYRKAVYVVPKPEVLLISETESPLATILSDLYELTQTKEIPNDLKGYKAVVLDDQRYRKELGKLKDFVTDDGGLVVVGGANSFELGDYYNSSLERVLPVLSKPSIFKGGKNAIIVLDISFSLLQTKTNDGTPLLDYEKSLAIELLKSPDLQDYKVGLVVFGTKAYHVADPMPLSRGRSVLEERIASLSPTGTENTHLDNGLQLARKMLNESGGQGELIVLSDGNLWNYEDVFQRSIQLIDEANTTTRLIQVQSYPGASGRFKDLAAKTGSEYATFSYPESLTTKVEKMPPAKPEEREMLAGFPISVSNSNHYISSGLELNATITGFNDITPKPGSQKLVSMDDGKPILTIWRNGLGRVASMSTDDGNKWAASIYTNNNSRLVSSIINWAVGDPRPETNRVESADGWVGTPLTIAIMSNSKPNIEGASVERIGENRYEATLTPEKTGVYFIGDYGVAVNYPLEYREIGLNPSLPGQVMANGGKVFTEKEAARSLISVASRTSQRTVQERASKQWVLLLAALTIFISEVVLRRLNEIRKRGKFKTGTS